MEWIDEEEQRRKHVAPVAASLTSSAASPQAVGPLIIDDFMSEWLHPNWSHVSCVAKLRLSVEQVQLYNSLTSQSKNVSSYLSAKVEDRRRSSWHLHSLSLLRKAISFFCFSSMADHNPHAPQLLGNWRLQIKPLQTQ